MFYTASAFNQDMSSWSTTALTDMTQMFVGAISFNHKLCYTAR
jgi:hypothetical protein